MEFSSILDVGNLTYGTAVICTVTSLILGLIIAFVYILQGNYSKNLAISLVLLPALVQVVIMMVNGNVGAGVAVLGAFSLVRFRSVPGSSKDICSIFFAMAIGLATGMGQITYAVMITLVISIVVVLLDKSGFANGSFAERNLRVTIPENLDYTNVFDDIFNKYLNKVSLDRVKTTNLGSMFELSYKVILKNPDDEKKMIDEIRCKNGNLTVILSRAQLNKEEL